MLPGGDIGLGFVIQRKPAVKPVYGKGRLPETVVLPDINLLRQHSKATLLSDTKFDIEFVEDGHRQHVQGDYLLDEKHNCEMLELWRPRQGDLVHYRFASNGLEILSVNGESNPDRVKNWPEISGVDKLPSHYPIQPLPLEMYCHDPDDFEGQGDLRFITLLAPVGPGHCVYVAAPGGSGKTTALRNAWRSCIRLTEEIPNFVVILTFVGERDGDLTDYVKDLENLRGTHKGIDPTRVEIYSSPEDDPDTYFEGAGVPFIQMTEFATSRARRLTQKGHHVALIIDCLSRAVDAHSVEEQKKLVRPGMGQQALSVTSVDWGRSILSTKGYFVDDRLDNKGHLKGDGLPRSLTIFTAVLLPGREKDERTRESMFGLQTLDSASTAKWVFTDANVGNPKIDVWKSSTRRVNRIAKPITSLQAQDMAAAMVKMRPGDGRLPRGFEAHQGLLDYGRDFPVPLYMEELRQSLERLKNPEPVRVR